jgi:hypothetical protein
MQALATYTASAQQTFRDMREGLTQALSKRDGAFGDYRTGNKS